MQPSAALRDRLAAAKRGGAPSSAGALTATTQPVAQPASQPLAQPLAQPASQPTTQPVTLGAPGAATTPSTASVQPAQPVLPSPPQAARPSTGTGEYGPVRVGSVPPPLPSARSTGSFPPVRSSVPPPPPPEALAVRVSGNTQTSWRPPAGPGTQTSWRPPPPPPGAVTQTSWRPPPPPPPRRDETLLALAKAQEELRAARVEIERLREQVQGRDQHIAELTAALARKPASAAPAGDDLKQIRGIGPLYEDKLKAAGIQTFAAIAQWTADDVQRIATLLGTHKTRIERSDWIAQAGALAAARR